MRITDLHGIELDVVGLDFETYYQDGRGPAFPYTLRKLTTTMYVRSPKFRAHGAGIRMPGDKKAWWVSHCELRDVLREIDWSKTALLCHNTAFDGFILSHHYGHIPAYYLDTLSMSRGEFGVHVPHGLGQLGERLNLGTKIAGELEKTANIYRLPWAIEKGLITYGLQDVDLMWDIFDKMYYDLDYPEKELHIIDQTIRAYCDPRLQVNHALCKEEELAEVEKKQGYTKQLGVTAKQLSSNPQFAELLKDRGVEPPVKISPTTGKETFAFSKADLDFQALALDERCSDLIRARKAVKSTINETRARRISEHGHPALPIMLNYCQARTHRWTAGDSINAQNLPSNRKGQSDRLRRALEAPDGQVLVVVDSSQIEARTNAWAAGEDSLLDIFRRGDSPYEEMASDIFGFPVNKKDHPDERQVGKTAELGCGYGMGGAKFAYTVRAGLQGPPVDISDETAFTAVNVYRKKRSRIKKQWENLDDALGRMFKGENFELGPFHFIANTVRMPNDLRLFYPGLSRVLDDKERWQYFYITNKGPVNLYGAKLDENLIQSAARTVVAQQALEIAKRYHIVSLVHDEIIFLADEDEADEALQYGIECLSTPPAFCQDLPVAAEGGYAKNYSK